MHSRSSHKILAKCKKEAPIPQLIACSGGLNVKPGNTSSMGSGIVFRTILQEQTHTWFPSKVGGEMERCPTIAIPDFYIRSVLNEQPKDLNVIVRCVLDGVSIRTGHHGFRSSPAEMWFRTSPAFPPRIALSMGKGSSANRTCRTPLL